jgi:hypothetical protein
VIESFLVWLLGSYLAYGLLFMLLVGFGSSFAYGIEHGHWPWQRPPRHRDHPWQAP